MNKYEKKYWFEHSDWKRDYNEIVSDFSGAYDMCMKK